MTAVARVRASIHESVEEWRKRWFDLFPRAWVPDIRSQAAALDSQGREFDANVLVRELGESFTAGVLHGDADDAKLCDAAEARADECLRTAARMHDRPGALSMLHDIADRWRVQRAEGESVESTIARYTDPHWWRRAIRRSHGRAIETAAIRLGRVNRRRDCYVSSESVARRTAQNNRNAAAMAATVLENEEGARFTVAELAEKSTSSKPIRRAELMVRMAGFEAAGKVRADAAEFVTMTCPSRFHPWTTVGGSLKRNPAHDAALTPRHGQEWLRRAWARIRARLARIGLPIYGFRIAEPQHDGTPHWHLILWYPGDRRAELLDAFTTHALEADCPDEPGARRYRLKFVPIDAAKGTATGYVAKYVAKNVDGIGLETDLLGNPIATTTARVEAWASTWGIRQFQQIGGPPVGLWREVRRMAVDSLNETAAVYPVPSGAPPCLRDAWGAAQAVKDEEGATVSGASFFRFLQACGGPVCPRDARPIRVARAWSDEPNRYGEARGWMPAGVETSAQVRDFGGIVGSMVVPIPARFESVRHQWRRVSNLGPVSITVRATTARAVQPAPDGGITQEELSQWLLEFEAHEAPPPPPPPSPTRATASRNP